MDQAEELRNVIKKQNQRSPVSADGVENDHF